MNIGDTLYTVTENLKHEYIATPWKVGAIDNGSTDPIYHFYNENEKLLLMLSESEIESRLDVKRMFLTLDDAEAAIASNTFGREDI